MPAEFLIHLATGNANKARELQRMADDAGAGLRFAAHADMPEVVEDTGSFVGNARKKAQALKALLPANAWVLADDSGLCVDELAGAPGVESAYFAGPAHDSQANLAKMVRVLRGVPSGRRGATFVCVLVLLGPNGQEQVIEGHCPGRLLDDPRGQSGFGYDPLFVPQGESTTFAELSADAKNRLSHRGRAFTALVNWVQGPGGPRS